MFEENIFFEYKEIDHKSLKAYIQKNKSLDKYFSINRDSIKAKNYCGILHIEGEDFYILPKISNKADNNFHIFLYMLMCAYDVRVENESLASSANQQYKIIEIFIHLFTNALLKELQLGLFKQYITYQENLQVLRGKYLINENLKHNFTRQKIYCEFDEFSPDNVLNQFFLYAINIFMRHSKDKKGLKMCEMILDEVSHRQIDINKLDIHFDRMNNRYKKSFEIAIMILKHYIPLFSKDRQSFAFLFDMNVLFENFVGKIIPNAKLQTQKNFGNLQLKPDIMIENLIIDTKYKKIQTRDNLSVADKYQMYVYGKNFQIKNTMLIYPKYQYEIREDLQLGEADKCVHLAMRCLDMDFDGGYEEYLVEMRERVKKILKEYEC